ncbi:MAG: helix-turn-helix domain-containing protein [Candidatus Aminicenantes bacterium]|nr:helix-turn-helix domain-containing protein [Candidatus Aminicenantes bacterium]NIM84906.1 helix-turn-helix domain-containing protein [Candidatus Aminicenantes bacterium]NIN24417.1 helix-turn-helix domain-containing protein [Candidatus Aminicenantes bacterium]NIN48181.1 helix-turn-helix domain-containing protein [Candidatus Aminicenantes bacterium]NIN91084.1 helix-turn-helix domain-containing protein [Candidatus Aminicenantes bacterium]
MDKSRNDLLKKLSNHPDYKDQVRILREFLGLTQEQLAKMVDRTPRSIRTIENGEAFPRISTLQKIAEALNAELKIALIPKTGPGIPGEAAGQEEESGEQDSDDTDPAEDQAPELSLDEQKGFIIGETD